MSDNATAAIIISVLIVCLTIRHIVSTIWGRRDNDDNDS